MEDKIKKNKTKNRAVHLYVELCEYTEQIRKTRHGPFLEAVRIIIHPSFYQNMSFYHISQTRIFRLRHKWDLSNCRICCCVLWMAGGHSSEASSYILSLFQNLRNSMFWNHNWASRWSRIGGVLELFS